MNRAHLAVILYADGQTPGQIAWQLACPTETVRTYLRRARREYVAQGRAQSRGLHRIALRALLVEDGLLAPEVSSHARTMVDVGTSEGDGMKCDLGDYIESSYGPAGTVIAYCPEPTYVLEGEDGSRVSVAESRIVSVRKPGPLPSVPGFYVGEYRDSPSGRIVIELLMAPPGQWVDNTDSRYLDEAWVRRLGNLTRLVPAA